MIFAVFFWRLNDIWIKDFNWGLEMASYTLTAANLRLFMHCVAEIHNKVFRHREVQQFITFNLQFGEKKNDGDAPVMSPPRR